LTPNGKVDRKALPVPEMTRPQLEEAFVPPRNPTEELLARIWVQVLGIDRVGIHDNYFDLGGASIQSLQIMTKANEAGLQLTPEMLFEYQTVAELATVATTNQSTVGAGEKVWGTFLDESPHAFSPTLEDESPQELLVPEEQPIHIDVGNTLIE